MTAGSAGERLRVAVLLGGPSSEHDVSIASGLQVLAALDPARREVLPVYLERNGAWRVGHVPERRSLDAASDGSAPAAAREIAPPSAADLASGLRELAAFAPDVAFVALHGTFGEDGTVQGLLSAAGIAFTGSGILASALAMDKLRTKEVLASHGIPMARHAIVSRRAMAADPRAVLEGLLAVPGLPCVVKPVAAGSSVATHVVERRERLAEAVEDALSADGRVLVESRLRGVEVTCGVLGGGAHEASLALPLTEICPKDGAFFDFRAKYTHGASEDITPARLDADTTARVQDLSLRAHEALGCEGMSRSDFIVQDGVPHFLETNTIPGMTHLSLLPQEAAAAGIPFPELVERLLRSALLRAGRSLWS